jgi:hypothetical protein
MRADEARTLNVDFLQQRAHAADVQRLRVGQERLDVRQLPLRLPRICLQAVHRQRHERALAVQRRQHARHG